ncbi:MAG TPA: MerR family transcriptional regulator [Bacteroidales bacterium]|mgnify:FL=1|nr:MerR family transcriptional regulator [Bacteroidales bacterium]
MEEGMNVFSIKDLEDFSGIKAHTIRIWEKRYGILEPERTDSNIRTYSESELKKILNIAYLKKNGYKISRIALLSEDELTREVISLSDRNKTGDRENHPDKILLSAIKFNDQQFTGVLTPLIRKHGLEEAYLSYLYPLQEKSRILWQTGSLSKAQEQFIRNIIKQVLICEEFNFKITSAKSGNTVAMINTSDLISENNFLFYRYLLRKKGYDVIFSGGTLPASEVIEIYKIRPFNFLIVNAGVHHFTDEKIGYFSNLGKSLFIKKIIFTDIPDPEGRKIPDNILISENPRDFASIIDSIW